MANFMVHINDRVSYFVEDCENAQEAKDTAMEWFYERECNCSVDELPPEVDYDNVHLNPKYNDIFDDLCAILEKRATDSNRSEEMRSAYNSALTMVLYALHNDRNALAQFDY